MLIAPIQDGTHDFVIASRVRGEREPGSMSWHQVLAGRLAGWIMSLLYGVRYTDMCAFRAIRRDALERLDMRETTYGWNIEMQMKAARAGLRILELPVPYRCRAGGSSKVAGSLVGQPARGLADRPDHCPSCRHGALTGSYSGRGAIARALGKVNIERRRDRTDERGEQSRHSAFRNEPGVAARPSAGIIDYLFFRMFTFLQLLLRASGRGI